MKTELFQMPTELPETLLRCSANRRVTHVPLEGANELFFTRVGSDSDYDGFRMIRSNFSKLREGARGIVTTELPPVGGKHARHVAR